MARNISPKEWELDNLPNVYSAELGGAWGNSGELGGVPPSSNVVTWESYLCTIPNR